MTVTLAVAIAALMVPVAGQAMTLAVVIAVLVVAVLVVVAGLLMAWSRRPPPQVVVSPAAPALPPPREDRRPSTRPAAGQGRAWVRFERHGHPPDTKRLFTRSVSRDVVTWHGRACARAGTDADGTLIFRELPRAE